MGTNKARSCKGSHRSFHLNLKWAIRSGCYYFTGIKSLYVVPRKVSVYPCGRCSLKSAYHTESWRAFFDRLINKEKKKKSLIIESQKKVPFLFFFFFQTSIVKIIHENVKIYTYNFDSAVVKSIERLYFPRVLILMTPFDFTWFSLSIFSYPALSFSS